ncbi:MAG: hypothetical protein IRZ31_02060 [Thermogemmatispora sp.]|uniref:hypothetical protein n=1 Tax=Thermogemmatispora TaxID=768669 RepID=UPI0016778768|nr:MULTISPECIES: hypothetical protein [Thermogemmatispora]MBX5455659.1 hypothetical protein [Thermogemmatispora sp.]
MVSFSPHWVIDSTNSGSSSSVPSGVAPSPPLASPIRPAPAHTGARQRGLQ